jgi:hypothetical protein
MNSVVVQTSAQVPHISAKNEKPMKMAFRLDDQSPSDWIEEILIDDGGDEIKMSYRGKATISRYEFIRDYLDFKINRMLKKAE